VGERIMTTAILCQMCLKEQNTERNYWEKTKCKYCSSDIVVIKHWGMSNPNQSLFAVLGFVDHYLNKCPCCKKNSGKTLGVERGEPRVVAGEWLQSVTTYRICNTCNGTWYTYESS